VRTVRRRLFSLAVGLVTPLPLLAILRAIQAPPLDWRVAVAGASLVALSLALLPEIEPLLFGVALIPATPAWYAILAGSTRSSNLFGLVLTFMAMGGVTVACASVFTATMLRHWPMPRWLPAAPLAAAVALVAIARLDTAPSPSSITARIAAAEKEYAAARPDHAFTCDGPKLPRLSDIPWRANTNLGTAERNEAQYGRYWIKLTCEPSARRSWYTVTARALWQGGPVLTYDSRR